MIKKILVPVSGRHRDAKVFATALAIARPLAAHMEFLRIPQSASEIAERAPHLGFSSAAVITDALAQLRAEVLAQLRAENASRTVEAIRHFETFCVTNQIPIMTRPGPGGTDACVSAHFEQVTDTAADQLAEHARHSDLVVLDRPDGGHVAVFNSIERLLLGSGRPVVIATDVVSSYPGRTIVVGWQESAEAARSLAAAMPLLQMAQKVVLVNIAGSQQQTLPALDEVRNQLAWHGIEAQVRVEQDHPRCAADHLVRIAARLGAGLLVIGGFGRGRVREALFGGVTQSIIEHATCPVFVMH